MKKDLPIDLDLELDDEFQMLDNIAYSFGLEFVGFKS